ncbi:MAG: hypothetical protein U0517_03845 [Candidatus Andersenbacteria bacterium]
MSKRLTQFAVLLIVLTLALGVPRLSRATDQDDLSDAHGQGPYDEVSCNGASEDELDTGDPAEDFFPPFQFDTNEQHNDGGGSFTGQYTFPFSDQEVFQLFNRRSEQATEPHVNVTIAPTEVEPGQPVSLIASLADFKDNGSAQNLQYAVGFSVDEISLQGIMAGGKKLPESPTGSSCGLVTRTPQVDGDGDGMDDNWEAAHGLNPTDPSDAFADPDNDSAAQFYTNGDDEELQVTPETAGGPTGVMNNLAEFTFDTDPNRADTDGDSITDGMEIIGFGGPAVTFSIERPVGSAVQVRAFAVGVSAKQDAEQEFKNIVKLDSSTRTFFISNGEHLKGQTKTLEAFTAPGQTAVIEAQFVGSEAEPDSFAYSYEVDGQEITNPSPARHRLEVAVDPTRTPGTTIPYQIEAVNPATGQLATMRGVIQVGEHLTLETDPVEPVAGGPVTVRAVLASGQDPLHYLYEWSLNDQLDEQASGIGRNAIELTAPAASGDAVTVNLRLFLVDTSQLVGQAALDLAASTPSVALEVIPESPKPGETVTVFARPKNFPVNFDSDGNGDNDATLLRYSWSVDGSEQPVQESAAGFSSITLPAGDLNQQHSLSVQVRSVGAHSETAGAEASFTTGVGVTAISARARAAGETLLASLGSAFPRYGAAVIAALGVVSLLGLAYWGRTRRTA